MSLVYIFGIFVSSYLRSIEVVHERYYLFNFFDRRFLVTSREVKLVSSACILLSTGAVCE